MPYTRMVLRSHLEGDYGDWRSGCSHLGMSERGCAACMVAGDLRRVERDAVGDLLPRIAQDAGVEPDTARAVLTAFFDLAP